MPSLTPDELMEARRASGRLGGRPRKPTIAEAREAALAELTPKALRVIAEHLDSGRPDAWRSALRVLDHAFGRPDVAEPPRAFEIGETDVMNLTPAEVAAQKQRILDLYPDLRAVVEGDRAAS